ncbi:hypothetical protein P5673_019193, partial [Acropora cervicornis]
MLISTPQMARYHSLEERDLSMVCGDPALTEREFLVLSHWASTWINTSHGTNTKFEGLEDVITFNWLPVKGNVEFNILKLAHKLLYDKNSFPEYLNLSLHQHQYSKIPKGSGTFQHSAATLFNRLP